MSAPLTQLYAALAEHRWPEGLIPTDAPYGAVLNDSAELSEFDEWDARR